MASTFHYDSTVLLQFFVLAGIGYICYTLCRDMDFSAPIPTAVIHEVDTLQQEHPEQQEEEEQQVQKYTTGFSDSLEDGSTNECDVDYTLFI